MNSIAGWSDELSKPKSDSRLTARQWRLARCPIFGELWVDKKVTNRAYRIGFNESRKASEKQRMCHMRRVMYANNSNNFGAIWNSKNKHNMLSNKCRAEYFAQQFCKNFTDKIS